MTEQWFKFHAYNAQTQYGHGTEAEASEYQDVLNAGRTVNHYAVTVVTEKATGGNAFSLADELFAAREAAGEIGLAHILGVIDEAGR